MEKGAKILFVHSFGDREAEVADGSLKNALERRCGAEVGRLQGAALYSSSFAFARLIF
jgi:hypothetical protein